VPSTSYAPLLPLLLEVLRWQHQQDDQDQEEREARMEAFQQAVSKRREELRAEYLQAARTRGTEITQKEEREIEGRAAQEAVGQITRERAGTPLVPNRPRTPWEAALSHLFPAMTVPLTDEHDPREKLAREYDILETCDEDALKEYLVQVRQKRVQKTSPLSAELARLDGAGFGNRLAESLRQEFPEEMQVILAAVPAAVPRTPDSLAAPSAAPATLQAAVPRKVRWRAEAMLLVREQPPLSDAEIARRVGVNPGTLSRCKVFQTAAAMARGRKTDLPKGHVEKDAETGKQRGIEAYSEEHEEDEDDAD
jgi:hypothetical protein